MIIGSGLLARAFAPAFSQRENLCIYAAGVSNSTFTDDREFARERQRLANALRQAMHVEAFVYFGTCSVADPEAHDTPYGQHKLAMEEKVCAHPQNLILHLQQVAGNTPNPHTLLIFLYARIARSERFHLWRMAKRNIIDVVDAVTIAQQLIGTHSAQNTMINIANDVSYPMLDIVSVMGRVVARCPIYDLVERGSGYPIDTRAISPVLAKAGVKFGKDYLETVLGKYYQKGI